MNIAIVGCGYVADFYCAALSSHPELKLVGVYDRELRRAETFATRYKSRAYASLDTLLGDPQVSMVLNLTNPAAHYEISRAALVAGKHVYSEKPFAVEMDSARELVELAKSRGLEIASAPSTVLGGCATTMARALQENVVGKVRLVYAEMDDGMVHRMPHARWRSASGVSWNAADEFATGCTLEHAGYVLTWLAAFFGPAESVTAFASLQIPDKLPGQVLTEASPDVTVACIRYAGGVVARLSCSIIAPHDHTLRIIGDDGVLSTKDVWDSRSPVISRKRLMLRSRVILSPFSRRHRLPVSVPPLVRNPSTSMDFLLGPSELAASIEHGKPRLLTAEFCLHINELVLAIHGAAKLPQPYKMTTTFSPTERLP